MEIFASFSPGLVSGVYQPGQQAGAWRRLGEDEVADGSDYLAYLHGMALERRILIFYLYLDRSTRNVLKEVLFLHPSM